MASVKLLLNKCRIRMDGTYPLVFQIIHHRKKKLMYTSYKLYPEEFDERNGKLIYIPGGRWRSREVARINKTLDLQNQSFRRYITILEQQNRPFDVAEIAFRYSLEQDQLGLLRYMDHQIEHKLTMNKFGMAAALKSTRSSLASFIGRRIVHLSDLNVAFVQAYEEFLIQRGVCPNTICFYMRNLKSIYNHALLEGYMSVDNPFRFTRVKASKTIKRALDRETLRRLANEDLSSWPNLDMARDLFMFSFFCRGMPFVDIIYLRKSDICNGVISYRRHKTNQWLQIAITPQLACLLSKYANPTEYVFPILKDNCSIQEQHRMYRLALECENRNLKQVARICDIPIPLTTYHARHSWATQAKNVGAPITVISEGLGHTSEKTTRIYLKELDRRVVDAINEKVSLL